MEALRDCARLLRAAAGRPKVRDACIEDLDLAPVRLALAIREAGDAEVRVTWALAFCDFIERA